MENKRNNWNNANDVIKNKRKIKKQNYDKNKYWFQPKCPECFANDIVSKIGNPKFDGYCFTCFRRLFPKDKRCKSKRLIKQTYIHDNVIMNNDFFKDILVSYDLSIKGGCSSGKKPDWLFDMGMYSVILECDEKQHKRTPCESKREMELMMDLGERPLVIIRFNPDKYTDINGKRHKSSFDMRSKGSDNFKYVVKTEFNRRKKILIKVLIKWLSLKDFPEKEFTMIHLFYDKFDKNKIEDEDEDILDYVNNGEHYHKEI